MQIELALPICCPIIKDQAPVEDRLPASARLGSFGLCSRFANQFVETFNYALQLCRMT
jgi:hypothetical protein